MKMPSLGAARAAAAPAAPTAPAAPARLAISASAWPTAAAGVAAIVLAFVQQVVWPELLGCVALGMVGWSWLTALRAPQYDVEVEAPERVVAGEPFEVVVHLASTRRTRHTVLVRHRLRGARFGPGAAAYVKCRGKETAVRLTQVAQSRGRAFGSELEIVVAAPFGFFTRRLVVQAGGPVLSWPAHAAPLDLRHVGGGLVGSPSVEPIGVREWRAGDRLRDVRWRAVARNGRLAVLDREPAPDSGLAIVVLAGPAGRAGRPDPDFERAVSIVAATGAAALRRGAAARLIAHRDVQGTSGEPEVAHIADERELLDRIAVAGPAGRPSDTALRHALAHAAHGGVVLLAASRSTPSDWKAHLRARAAIAGVTVIDARHLMAKRRQPADLQ